MNAYWSADEDRVAMTGVSLIDRFAEALADCGDLAWACSIANVTPEQGDALFQRICRKLGPQAI